MNDKQFITLNNLVKPDVYKFAKTKDINWTVHGSTVFTVIDFNEGLYYIEIWEEDKKKQFLYLAV